MPFGETATGLDVIRSTTSGAVDQVVCLSMGGGNSPARPDSIYVRAWYGGRSVTPLLGAGGGAESVTKSLNGLVTLPASVCRCISRRDTVFSGVIATRSDV